MVSRCVVLTKVSGVELTRAKHAKKFRSASGMTEVTSVVTTHLGYANTSVTVLASEPVSRLDIIVKVHHQQQPHHRLFHITH